MEKKWVSNTVVKLVSELIELDMFACLKLSICSTCNQTRLWGSCEILAMLGVNWQVHPGQKISLINVTCLVTFWGTFRQKMLRHFSALLSTISSWLLSPEHCFSLLSLSWLHLHFAEDSFNLTISSSNHHLLKVYSLCLSSLFSPFLFQSHGSQISLSFD